MLIRLLIPACLWFSAKLVRVRADEQDYFQLQSAAGGCIGRQILQDELYLKECNSNDPNVMWRWDEQNRLHSKAAENECIQAGQFPQVLQGANGLNAGTPMYLKLCNENLRLRLQSFSEDWELAGLMGDMYLQDRPDLCMTHFGSKPVIGESKILLLRCDTLNGNRAKGWTAVFPVYEYFTLKAFGGGCLARPLDGPVRTEMSRAECTDEYQGIIVADIGDGTMHRPDYVCESSGLPPIGTVVPLPGEPIADEGEVCCGSATPLRTIRGRDGLFLKACSSIDEAIQWRVDDMSRFRSKIDDSVCMQAEAFPAILRGPSVLRHGSPMYVKTCGTGRLKNQFQIVNTAIPMPLTLEGPQGTLSLVSRPDLCIVPFGAVPVLGESRIMLADCQILEGNRARGWNAVPPCDHPPSCRVCSLDVKICPDGEAVGRDPSNGCAFFPCPVDRVCTADVKICPNGDAVGRDPYNDCEFFPCQGACTFDVKPCPDGSSVGRNPNNNCEFFPCPSRPACTLDVFTCPDGSTVGRDPQNNCEFSPCQSACTLDVLTCSDGSTVGRDPENNCEFFPCITACPLDVFTCPDGTELVRVPPECEFPPCPVVCTLDLFVCPDGTSLVREPPDCEFPPCPTACTLDVFVCPDGTELIREPPNCAFPPCPAACTLDVKECPDGTAVGRDPNNACQFFPCPAPLVCQADVFVCSDGTELVRVPPDCVFPSCPRTAACAADVRQCPDGSSVDRNPDNNCEFFPCPVARACSKELFVCPDGSSVGRVPPLCDFRPCGTA